ncbi:hypothetical protein [Halomarina oriensis]|uniref:Transporter n=1 Tax=Halomarina oriensis TaxID=671145 RepID=A0A6B0GI56_9EURY|nr:hypothetical protein [Halomarina oriensis]MWG33567.1 hypothetical protein [Halomarina oriensis]
MRSTSRTVVGYALLFSVPPGAGLGVAVQMTSGDPPLALASAVGVALVLFLVLLGLFGSGSTDH